MEQMTNAIRNVNREVQLQQWQQQIMDCRSGGLTVGAWCAWHSNHARTRFLFADLPLNVVKNARNTQSIPVLFRYIYHTTSECISQYLSHFSVRVRILYIV